MAYLLGRRQKHLVATVLTLAILGVHSPAGGGSFVNFESGHVRPLALGNDPFPNRDLDLLFAVNTPDNRLSIFRIESDGSLSRAAEVPVGMEPVAVAVRAVTGNPSDPSSYRLEAWVVNHLSDSVSIVPVDPRFPEKALVTRTILLCDEPRDIVFAGTGDDRAFITTARRGQNCPVPANLTQKGEGRGVVQVFDVNNLTGALDGPPLENIILRGDTPRALARDADGGRVFAAVFHSGNRTATIPEPFVSNHPIHPGLPPNPMGSVASPIRTGLIVKEDKNKKWTDSVTRDWSDSVAFDLPDTDVFLINARLSPPGVISQYSGFGTTIFNMVVRPGRGWLECAPIPQSWQGTVYGLCYAAWGPIWPPLFGVLPCPPVLYVSNTEALNERRFLKDLRGHFSESRITRLGPVPRGTGPRTAVPLHLNTHIDYSKDTSSPANLDKTLAIPMGLAVSNDRARLYVAGFGSDNVGIFDLPELDCGDTTKRELKRVGRGPTGLVLDEQRDQLYVMNRVDHTISVLINASQPALASEHQVKRVGYDPSPAQVRDGRPFLYEARTTSAHGDVACASCHVFGDLDGVAWDLGDPYSSDAVADVPKNPNGFRVPPGPPFSDPNFKPVFHPMKGPMSTQSLRGMTDAGPMHWRGDRTGGLKEDNRTPSGGDFLDEREAFKRFNGAFVDLLGGVKKLDPDEMNDFTSFILTLRYPPNPIQNLDDTLSDPIDPSAPSEKKGSIFFNNVKLGSGACADCHQGSFGTVGLSSIEGGLPDSMGIVPGNLPQEMKIPHLRNLYQKVGMFGFPDLPGVPARVTDKGDVGDQVRGFGFLHDGSVSTLFTFLQAVFDFETQNLTPVPTAQANLDRRNVEAFLLAFDTGLKPAVGQQVTVTATTKNDVEVKDRLDLLVARDEAGDCELMAKGLYGGNQRGFVYTTGGNFQSDKSGETHLKDDLLNDASLLLTFTCVPPGSGHRIGIDRDDDGILDGDNDPQLDPPKPTP